MRRASIERRDKMRNRPKKPILKKSEYLKYDFVIMEREDCLCPKCGNILNAGPGYQPKYCSECGQKINFTGVQWKKDKQLGFAERRNLYEPVKN